MDLISDDKYVNPCMQRACKLEENIDVDFYLCPERKKLYDGFVNDEGRQFGVPYWYIEKVCMQGQEEWIHAVYL